MIFIYLLSVSDFFVHLAELTPILDPMGISLSKQLHPDFRMHSFESIDALKNISRLPFTDLVVKNGQK